MKFSPPLTPARLVQRYKRFLADVILENGDQITVHVPNTGSMKNCWEAGWQVYLENSNNPKRKYLYTWNLAKNNQQHWIGVNTNLPNKLVLEAIQRNRIAEIGDVKQITTEVKYGKENSRIDLLVELISGEEIYIEVKNVTLLEEDSIGYFPDSVSTRGQKHLRELMDIKKEPYTRSMLFFCVQHSGIEQVKPADHIDAMYGQLLREAHDSGVEIVAYQASMSPQSIEINNKIPVLLN